MIIDLVQLKPGQSGVVVEIQGGWGMTSRVHNLGIREGKHITKVSTHFWRGPQTVTVGSTQVSLGYGMASRIMVEVEERQEA